MRIFIFYPDTYVRVCGGRSVVMDTARGWHAIYPFALSQDEYPAWIDVTDENRDAIGEMEANGAGYALDCQVPPFVPARKIHLGSSVTGSDGLTPYAEGFHTKSLLRRLNLHLHNSRRMDPAACRQLDYPEYNVCGRLPKPLLDFIVNEYEGELVLSGDVDDYMVSAILWPLRTWFENHKFGGRRCRVKVRTLCTAENVEWLAEMERGMNNLPIAKELILGRNYFPSDRQIKEYERIMFHGSFPDMLSLTLMVEGTNDIDELTKRVEAKFACRGNMPKVRKVPILYGEGSENNVGVSHFAEMVAMLQMSEADIFAGNRSMRRILQRQRANVGLLGTVSVDIGGDMWCGAQKVGSVADGDIYGLLNRWVHSRDCAWWQSRARVAGCRGCLLRDLCPSVSVYEQMGILNRLNICLHVLESSR